MTQPWTLEPTDVVDGAFLLKCLDDAGRHILTWLAEHPGVEFTYDDLHDRFAVSLSAASPARTVAQQVRRANEIAVSYGRDQLIEVRGAAVRAANRTGAALVIAAQRELERWERRQAEVTTEGD